MPASKRLFDLTAAVFGLVITSPLFVAAAVAIKLQDGGAVFYRQERIGRHGRPFRIWKFRSMRERTEETGPCITAAGDPRITTIGRFLREWKIDELPQLINVIVGQMSIVGPRPEVPQYVGLYSESQRAVLQLSPGITDVASVEFRNEEQLLAHAPDREKFYIEYCIPRKIELNLRYAGSASIWTDIRLIAETVLVILRRQSTAGLTSGDVENT